MDKRPLYLGLAAFVVLGLAFTGVFGRRIWQRIRGPSKTSTPLPVSAEPVGADGTYTNLIFLHHSTGANLIAQGDLRALLAARGYKLWDHDYNRTGLTRPDGTRLDACYAIPELTPGITGSGNTDPEGLAVLFAQPVHTPPDNAFSRLLQHEVLIFKSCFPNSAIESDEMLIRRQALYLGMRDVVDAHPDRLFIFLTTPPLHPLATNASAAARAQKLAQWMVSPDFLAGHPNLAVFDFYDLLADPATGMLRAEYQRDPANSDSHPNELANQTIAPLFADFLDETVQAYRRAR